MNSEFFKLILVTHRQECSLPEYLDFIKQCVSSGVTCVQLREKNSTQSLKLKFALSLKELLTPYAIPLIINDDIDLAIQIDAAGVHLGQSDASPQYARERLGENKYIGLSIESETELREANCFPLNYVAASAIFPTCHKDNLKRFWGINGLTQLCKQTQHPIIGIGGINQDNLAQVIQAGACGVAVIGTLHQAENPAQMALNLRKIIESRR